MKQQLTRRECLFLLAKMAGGSAAMMQAAKVLGIEQPASTFQYKPLAKVSAKRPHVLILGAGVSALVSAYELTKAGYSSEILEASHRVGGRNLTVRHGDLIDEIGNRQICDFDDHANLYFNCGPARLPAHHHGIMHYCIIARNSRCPCKGSATITATAIPRTMQPLPVSGCALAIMKPTSRALPTS